MLNFIVGSAYLRHRRLVALSLTFFLFVVIGFLTLTPATMLPEVTGSDKTHHVVAFAALAFPCALLYRMSLYWLVPAILIFGTMIELVQPYVGRYGERADFYADFIGAIIGVSMGLALNHLITWLIEEPQNH
jgi:VanZ family protein